jgi:hypothetical protein
MAESYLWDDSIGFKAAGALGRYNAVKLIDADTVGPVTAEGDVILGISMYPVSAGEITKGKGASVCVSGAPLVEVGSGGVTLGTIVVSDATGKAVASNSGARPLGIALASGNAGEFVPVLLTPGSPLVP